MAPPTFRRRPSIAPTASPDHWRTATRSITTPSSPLSLCAPAALNTPGVCTRAAIGWLHPPERRGRLAGVTPRSGRVLDTRRRTGADRQGRRGGKARAKAAGESSGRLHTGWHTRRGGRHARDTLLLHAVTPEATGDGVGCMGSRRLLVMGSGERWWRQAVQAHPTPTFLLLL
jgi:hypothetical protein